MNPPIINLLRPHTTTHLPPIQSGGRLRLTGLRPVERIILRYTHDITATITINLN